MLIYVGLVTYPSMVFSLQVLCTQHYKNVYTVIYAWNGQSRFPKSFNELEHIVLYSYYILPPSPSIVYIGGGHGDQDNV